MDILYYYIVAKGFDWFPTHRISNGIIQFHHIRNPNYKHLEQILFRKHYPGQYLILSWSFPVPLLSTFANQFNYILVCLSFSLFERHCRLFFSFLSSSSSCEMFANLPRLRFLRITQNIRSYSQTGGQAYAKTDKYFQSQRKMYWHVALESYHYEEADSDCPARQEQGPRTK